MQGEDGARRTLAHEYRGCTGLKWKLSQFMEDQMCLGSHTLNLGLGPLPPRSSLQGWLVFPPSPLLGSGLHLPPLLLCPLVMSAPGATLGSWEIRSPHSNHRGLPPKAASWSPDTGRWGWLAHHELWTIPWAQSWPWVSPACPERSCLGKDIGPFPEQPHLWAQVEGKASS